MSAVMEGESSGGEQLLEYSAAVQTAIDSVLPDDDPFYRADFDVTDHINSLFPTEQSLSKLDETTAQVRSFFNTANIACESIFSHYHGN